MITGWSGSIRYEDDQRSSSWEIVAVISRYFVIDGDQLKLDITRHEDLSALVFNTPIISAKARQPIA